MTHPENNIRLSSIFHNMADCYRYLGTSERFRSIAYENAAKILYNMKEDIAVYAKDVQTLDELGGIGESIAQKIIEFLQTGKIKTFDTLKKQVPFELLELMNIKGMGPSTLKTLHENLNISNREDLEKALNENKFNSIKGFGAVKIENIKRSLKLGKDSQKRILLKDAEKIGNQVLNQIKQIPFIHQAELAGSLRRRKETIGDIDIIITADEKNWKKIIQKIIDLPLVETVITAGRTKASMLLKEKKIQVDVRIVHDNEFGSAMLYFTGSKEHNVKLRTMAKEVGYKINEYGLFNEKNERLAGKTEQEMYQALGLKYIPPEKRLNEGEIEKGRLKTNLN
jgi:DNA polymerase (family X)